MGGGMSLIIPLIIFAGLFFVMTRSQKKQQNERQSLLDSMKLGDKVVTIGGLHGIVSELNSADATVCIDCEGIILEFDRAAIKTVTPGETKEPEAATVIVEEQSIKEKVVDDETTE